MPTASDWRSQAIAAETADLDYADFAQEFLRHNKEYRRQYARYAARRNGASSKETLSTGFARRWGWCFPIDPDVSAAVSPALWRPEVAPGTVALAPPPRGLEIRGRFAPERLGLILADHSDEGGRHLVIDDPGGRLRLWLAEPNLEVEPAIVLTPDRDYALRRSVADRLALRLQAPQAGACPQLSGRQTSSA